MADRLNIVELYAGTARSSEPFKQWKRAKVSLLVDISTYARETYLHNFPRAPYIRADLQALGRDGIESSVGGKVDVLLACPPCQGFSEVGARGIGDPRNRHITIFGKYLETLRPKAFALENVPQFIASRQYRSIINRLEPLGYMWTAGILNAALRGSSQCRQRFVLVGIHRDIRTVPQFPTPSHGGNGKYFSYRFGRPMQLREDPIGLLGKAPSTQRFAAELPYREQSWGGLAIPTVAAALAGLPEADCDAELFHTPWEHSQRILRRMGKVTEGGRWEGGQDHFSQSYGRLHRSGLARTITAYFNNPGSGRYWHPRENRALTVREAARIQGFPDSFRFLPPRSMAAVLVGNALDAALAGIVFEVIRRGLE